MTGGSIVRQGRSKLARLATLAILIAAVPTVAPATTTSTAVATTTTRAVREVIEAVDVAPVWAGHPTQFALLTHGKLQFVGFYDANRQMTIGKRSLDSTEWEFTKLPEKIVWDSHNYITMTLDSEEHLHVSGNMHNVPLVYFQSKEPLDIATLNRVTSMTGEREKRCTYPEFIKGPEGQLIFTYRDGGSGNGDQIFNVYDTKNRKWSRLLDAPLASGEGKMNAYFHGPVKGPDGYFHLCWVWRDTSDCATNHDLSYARSRDLINWETGSGKPLKLPITIETAEIVDPVPVKGGMINGNTVIGFDSAGRPIITYHKYDPDGNTQIYNARLEDGKWNITQCSNWDYRWDFSGGGTIGFQVGVRPVEVAGEGRLIQRARNPKDGAVSWILDETTMKPVGTAPREPSIGPARWRRVESKFPGMRVRWGRDITPVKFGEPEYTLRWETLPQNRDAARKGPLPEPSMLRVIKLAGSCART